MRAYWRAARWGLAVDAAWKDVGASICRSHVQPVLQRGSGLFGDFKLNRTAGLVLDNRRPVSPEAMSSTRILTKSQPRILLSMARLNIARSRLRRLHLKSDTNGPDLFRPKGTLLANGTAFVPSDARRSAVGLDFGGMVDLHPLRSHRSARARQAGHRIAAALSRGTLCREQSVSGGKPSMALRWRCARTDRSTVPGSSLDLLAARGSRRVSPLRPPQAL
jgi:hypothetical protein